MSNTRVVAGAGFRVCFDDEPDYLRAYVFDGVDSRDVSVSMWQMLASECRRVSASRLLVLEDLLATVEFPQLEEVIDAMFSAGLGSVRVGFVELRDDIQGNEMAEILCRERGMAVRVFSQEAPARRWLIYGD